MIFWACCCSSVDINNQKNLYSASMKSEIIVGRTEKLHSTKNRKGAGFHGMIRAKITSLDKATFLMGDL